MYFMGKLLAAIGHQTRCAFIFHTWPRRDIAHRRLVQVRRQRSVSRRQEPGPCLVTGPSATRQEPEARARTSGGGGGAGCNNTRLPRYRVGHQTANTPPHHFTPEPGVPGAHLGPAVELADGHGLSGERGHVDAAPQLLHGGGVGGRALPAVLLVRDA